MVAVAALLGLLWMNACWTASRRVGKCVVEEEVDLSPVTVKVKVFVIVDLSVHVPVPLVVLIRLRY